MTSTSGLSRFSRTTRVALLTALLWSVGLVVAAFTAPSYAGQSSSSAATLDSSGSVSTTTTATTFRTATLIEVNGMRALVVAAVPLLATLVVGFLLLRFPDSKRARRAGWAVTVLAWAFNALAMSSIGVFFLPATASLLVAMASATGSGQRDPGVVGRASPLAP